MSQESSCADLDRRPSIKKVQVIIILSTTLALQNRYNGKTAVSQSHFYVDSATMVDARFLLQIEMEPLI